MKKTSFALILFLMLILTLYACSSDDEGENAIDGDNDEAVDGDGSEADGDTEIASEDDSDETADGDDDVLEQSEEGEEESISGLFNNPHDGKLYAATGRAIITPDESNFPCIQYMGGTGSNRLAEGTYTDLEMRVLVLEQDGVHLVLVAQDLIGWIISDVDAVQDELETYGIDRTHVVIHSTHTHTGPDTIGVYGPDWNITGRCPEYADFLKQTIVDAVIDISDDMVPVELYATETKINEPLSNHETLLNDIRIPFVTNDNFSVAKLVKENGDVLASVINWNSHPEAMIVYNEYSADFPHWARNTIEAAIGGTALYFSGTVGGMMTPIGLDVPEYTEDGQPVMDGDTQKVVSEDSDVKAWSLGYKVAEYALAALENAEKISEPLKIETSSIKIPLENMVFVIAFQMGVLPEYDGMITDDMDFCGMSGCFPQVMQHITFGKLHIIPLPGELFPEISVGREESSYDWGTDEEGNEWGVMEYPAITGYRSVLPEGHILMEFGLSNNEIGYVLPESDYTLDSHPSHYEEYFSIGEGTAKLLSDAIIELLSEE